MAIAGAIAGIIREQKRVEMRAVGAGAVNQAIKAVIIARRYLEQDGLDLVLVPSFVRVEMDGEKFTHLVLEVCARPLSTETPRGHPPC